MDKVGNKVVKKKEKKHIVLHILCMNTDIFRQRNKEGICSSQYKKDNIICFTCLSE